MHPPSGFSFFKNTFKMHVKCAILMSDGFIIYLRGVKVYEAKSCRSFHR